MNIAEQFVAKCQTAISHVDPIEAVRQVMIDTIKNPDPWRAAMEQHTDGVISLAMNDELTALQVSTEPEVKSPIHNHLTWVVIGMYAGEEHNYFYRRNDDVLELAEERTLKAGDVFVMDANAIHAIKNPSNTVNGALHVYGGNLMSRPGRSYWHPDSEAELPYDYEQVIAFSRKS